MEWLIKENEYKTKDGDEISFKFETDVERENRGFVVHELTAFVDNEKVGYLKISYIPEAEWEKRYKGDWGFLRWLKNFKGMALSRRENDLDAANLALSKQVDSLSNWLANNREEYDKLSREEKKELFDQYIERVNDLEGEKYEFDKAFHVDKPLVDYINVDPEERRRGIGFALYKKGAKILSERFGLPLYASGVQTEYAEKAWEKLKRLLPVNKEVLNNPYTSGDPKKVRFKIDYT